MLVSAVVVALTDGDCIQVCFGHFLRFSAQFEAVEFPDDPVQRLQGTERLRKEVPCSEPLW